MTESNKLETMTIALSDEQNVVNKLKEVQDIATKSNAQIYDCSKIIVANEDGSQSLDLSRAATHDLQIIPIYSSGDDKKLTNVAIALAPKFDEVMKSEIGIEYLKNSYLAKIIKRIRDNLRIAILENREYSVPVEIADFWTTSRASGNTEEFKKAVSALVKMLIEKFTKKYPYARNLLTAKTMIQALSNESFAKQVYPFLINKEGNTILAKWLENTKAEFNQKGYNTAEIDNMLATRDSAIIEEVADEDISVDDLF